MNTPRLFRAVLYLYPHQFRHRFGAEWMEHIEWRTRLSASKRRGRLSAFWLLTLDAVRAIPRAHASVVIERFSGLMSHIHRRVGRTKHRTSSDPSRRDDKLSLDSLGSDLKHAARGLVKHPRFTTAALVSLTLGVGANAGLFSVVNAVVLRPLPYENPDRLTFIWNSFSAGLSRLPLSPVEMLELRSQTEIFESVAAIWATTGTHYDIDEPVLLSVGLVTPNFLATLGVEPPLGRTFLEGESGVGPGQGVLLSNEFWRTRFAGDSTVLGQTLRIDGAEETVLGVLPPGFKLMLPPDAGIPETVDLLAPIPWPLSVIPPDQHFLRIVARLHPGVTHEQAESSVRLASERIRQRYAVLAASGDEFSIVNLQADATRVVRPVLLTLLAGAMLFLLIAAANVASLTLARASGRRHEIVVRSCLGASKHRIVRLLLFESTVIITIGSFLGLIVGWWSAKSLWALRPEGLATVDTVSFDWSVVGFTILVASAVVFVVALAPLLHLRRADLSVGMRGWAHAGSRATWMTRKIIAAGEVALALVLLIGAGLLIRTFAHLQTADMGFDPERLLSFRVALSVDVLPTDHQRATVARDLENAIRALPGVVAVGATSHIPYGTWANWSQSAPPDGTPESRRDEFHFDHRAVTSGYLESIGARLASGRWFQLEDDQTKEPVIVIDQAVAERAFPDTDPVGRRLHSTRYFNTDFVPTWATIVGVVSNMRDRTPSTPSTGQVFWPFAQSPRWELTYAVRTEAAPEGLTEQIRATVGAVRGDLAPSNFRTMNSYVVEATADTRFTLLLTGVFSTLAVVLATLGVYGVITYNTIQRTNEIGIRMALGAPRRRVFRSVVTESVMVCGLGIVIGFVAALGLTRFMSSLLFNVSATDPWTFGTVGLVFLVIAVLASYSPARRATKIDPISSLRPQ